MIFRYDNPKTTDAATLLCVRLQSMGFNTDEGLEALIKACTTLALVKAEENGEAPREKIKDLHENIDICAAYVGDKLTRWKREGKL